MDKKLQLSATALISIGVTLSMLSPASAHAGTPGYWTTEEGKIIRNGFGQCWRTRYWQPEHAIAECEGSTDSDNDGIADEHDNCPNTPANTKVGKDGCELDSDGDGVVDSKDRCPTTPAGEKVDATGCKLADLDSDGDGVIDRLDRCPSTPAGASVDHTGCIKDSDNDGVADNLDRCPSTPAGTKVDARGCEIDSDRDGIVDSKDSCPSSAAGAVVDSAGCELEETIVLKGVNFKTSSDILETTSTTVLDDVARTLQRYPSMKVEVAGYTDNRGSLGFNQQLSQRRAQAVLNYLVSQGVSSANLSAKGYGPESPIADNNTASGRAANRRVELHILER